MWRGEYRQIQIPQPSKIPSKNRVSPHTSTTYNVYIPVTHRISPHMLYHSQDCIALEWLYGVFKSI